MEKLTGYLERHSVCYFQISPSLSIFSKQLHADRFLIPRAYLGKQGPEKPYSLPRREFLSSTLQQAAGLADPFVPARRGKGNRGPDSGAGEPAHPVSRCHGTGDIV